MTWLFYVYNKSVMSFFCFQDISSQSITDALQNYSTEFNCKITEIKPLQLQAIQTLLSKKDCICALPTGYGKSFIYEILPFFVPKCLVIVIVPLNAIIEQQTVKLSGQSFSLSMNIDTIDLSNTKYFFFHPETVLNSPEINKLFRSSQFQEYDKFLVIDEAHCVIEWGKEFRKDFKRIYQLKSLVSCPILALSATITRAGQKEIAKCLHMTNFEVVCASPAKDNIKMIVKNRPSPNSKGNTSLTPYDYIFVPVLQQLKSELDNFGITIIYCKTMNWIGYGYELGKEILGDEFYSGAPSEKTTRVVMYHSSMEGPDGKVLFIFNFTVNLF